MSVWAVTGGSGLVGRFIVEDLCARGENVVLLSRTRPAEALLTQSVKVRPFLLDEPSGTDLQGCQFLIHCAFDHVPGRYRGGEGDDPGGFLRRNVDGSLGLFDVAKRSGVKSVVFLSSRAVYGDYPAGTALHEALLPRPDTLYGQAKLAVESGLAALATDDFTTATVRATGIYGPAAPWQRHKWTDLFTDHLGGNVQPSRVATELHGADLADAVLRLAGQTGIWNASDLCLDRSDLLRCVNEITGCETPLPEAADPTQVSEMDSSALRSLGWAPGGWRLLERDLPRMLGQL